MRVWDVPPKILCRNHLLGEHRELHAIWVILTRNKKGYRNHPETKRWIGALKALYRRHEALVEEMSSRGFKHRSDLDRRLAKGRRKQTRFVDVPREQLRILRKKGCECRV